MTEGKKIAVLMWFDKNIKDYADINYEINDIYCKKYGYTLIKSDVRRCPERKPHWERIPLLLENFEEFDYLIWIDADAHFYVDSPPITNVIDTHSDKLIIFSGDKDAGKVIKCEINSGFFIVKTCEESKNILIKWLTDENLFKSPLLSQGIFGANKWNDQAIIRLMYNKNIVSIKDNSIIIEYGVLQHFFKSDKLKSKQYDLIDKPFVYHCTNGTNMFFENRVKASNNYLALHKYSRFIHPNIQLSKDVIHDILGINCENKKMLVFGLGYDSELWYNFANQNVFFIEHNKEYINLNKNIPSKNIAFYSYSGISVKKSYHLTKEQIDAFKLPQSIIENAPYDIILIDGPNGSDIRCPGRLLPIFWSKKYLSKQGTIIYVDDVNRDLEKKCVNKYFANNKKTYFSDRLGTMKIYV
jgi:hypothetical protein